MKRLILVACLLAGCASGTSSGETSSDDSGSSKFTQTWGKDYGDTTCDEWNRQMTSQQQFVAAADMLVNARQVDGSETLPPDALIRDFQSGMTNACEPVASMKLSEIGAALYVTEGTRYRP